MSFRRDYQNNESVALPLETTFNSSIDGVIDVIYSNRVLFKYPPEWITSNVNEKIIGIRNIHIKRKCKTIKFLLYVRKYKKAEFDKNYQDSTVEYLIQLMDNLLDDLPDVFWEYLNRSENKDLKQLVNDESRQKYSRYYYQLNRNQKIEVMKSVMKYNDISIFMRYALDSNEIININKELNNSDSAEKLIEIQISKMSPNDIAVFRIPIQITIDENDSWNDIHDKLMSCIAKTNLYDYIRSEIISQYDDPKDLSSKLTQLNSIRDDYDLMLSQSNTLIKSLIPFYITTDDVGVFNYNYKQMKQLVLEQPSDILIDNNDYYCDYLITPNNDDSYKKCYKWPDNQEKPENAYPYLLKTSDISYEDKCFVFDSDTRNFLNIGSNKGQNPVEYVCKYHRNLYFHNVRTDIKCRIAASFANQSNHNIIGKTNETFENIKYYKINDNGDSFWIECYDNDDISIPINFNNDVVITMDVVFLQNRKLLYS